MLEAPRIHSAGRQRVFGGVAHHVDVDRESQPSGFPSPFNHSRNAHASEGKAEFVQKNIVDLDAFGCIGPPQIA